LVAKVSGNIARGAIASFRASNVAFRFRSEFKINSNFVILKSNERKGKARVSAKPKLKRNIQSSCLSLGKTSSG
jgi:hypothetical protein